MDSHRLFGAVETLLREVDVTPADVAENLTPKAPGEDADSCLATLVEALEKAKAEKLAKEKGNGKEAADEADSEDRR